MLYSIENLAPFVEENDCGRLTYFGFFISLAPEYKEAVVRSGVTQQDVNNLIKAHGRFWLDGCGYHQIYDPDNCGVDADPKLPPGPRARPLYDENECIRVTWGEWGPEHITVPGNGCGLDLNSNHQHKDGRVLNPHNVDSMRQAYLLLIIFTFLSTHVMGAEHC